MPTLAMPCNCHPASHNNMFAISALSLYRFPRFQLAKMKLFTIAACFVAVLCLSTSAADHTYNWSATHSRTWAGSNFWANRLQDWAVRDGRLECIADQSRLGVRTLHTLTHRLNGQTGRFQLDVTLGLANDTRGTVNHHGLAGFLIGVGGDSMDYRAAAIVHQFRGPGAGILAGVRPNGSLVIQDFEQLGSLQYVADVPSGTLNREKWKIVDVDSIEIGSPAANILDGNDNTIWHTQWRTAKPQHPHHVTIDMGQANMINGFAYQPRKSNATGRILKYAFYISADGKTWGDPIASGSLPDGEELQQVSCKAVQGRFLKLVALSSHLDRPSTVMAEFYALGQQGAVVKPAPPIVDTLAGHRLRLYGFVRPEEDHGTLTLDLINIASGDIVQSLSYKTKPARLIGNVALVSHPGQATATHSGCRFWFQDWQLQGNKLSTFSQRGLGPVIGAQHTISRDRLKLTAQLAPIGVNDVQESHLEVQRDDQWVRVATTTIIVPGYTAPFAIDNWESDKTTPYRVVYETRDRSGQLQTSAFTGTIRRDPIDKQQIVVAGFTGNHNVSHGIGLQPFDWRNGMWFPHQEVSDHVTAHKPDVLFFSGDQLYEGRSPTFPDTQNILLDYLYKWYLWSWAYRDLTRDIPTVTIPDDHDVFQGNVWGEGGRKAARDHFGGYVHPAAFIKMVDRTQTSHLPDAYDPTKIAQGIGVYYTSMTYGRISFAILEDRKFKSGCAGRLPPTGTARPDHINNPKFDILKADVPGLKLLGDRQLTFLEDWSGDWKGSDMKMALSQTIFANMATHHGGGLQYLIADLDSNGWPQTGRNKAISALRKGFAFHLAGDQHLATIVHHGVEEHNNSIWSFCVPSIANFYPRMWQPKVAGTNRPAGAPPWQGEHFDGFGNRVTVYAATNPGPDMGHEPKALHNGMPGYGIVIMDKGKRTIKMECWPRFADPTDPAARPYPGWPKTISQTDNYLRKAVAFLPTIETDIDNPVIQVLNDKTAEVIYTIRINGRQFSPKVFAAGTYTIVVSEPDKQWSQSFKNIEATPNVNGKIEVTLTP